MAASKMGRLETDTEDDIGRELLMTTKTTDTIERPRVRLFKVALVEKTESPQGEEEQGWHRYVLDNGISKIVGTRRGKLKEVNAYVKRYVEQLNERYAAGRSPANPRGKKPAQNTTAAKRR